jgi:hypothetical protein
VIAKLAGQDATEDSGTRNGTLSPQLPITDAPVNTGVENLSTINAKDRNRWRITVSYRWSKVEV